MILVDGVCTGANWGEDIPRDNFGAGGVGFVGCYHPWNTETPKGDDSKCLIYSNLWVSAWLLFDVLLGACWGAGNSLALSNTWSSPLYVIGIRWAETKAASEENT